MEREPSKTPKDKTNLWAGFNTGACGGTAAAALSMHVAWRHNPQGAFHDPVTGTVHWADWLIVGASWFVLGWRIAAVTIAGLAVSRWLRRRSA